jgi:hypothetical protein
MATADEYAAWIVKNESRKGTPEFDTVAKAYQIAKEAEAAPPADVPADMSAPAVAAQPSNGRSPGIGYQPAMPAGGRPGMLKGLAGAGEGALSIASGIPASLAGGAIYAGVLGTTLDPKAAEAARAGVQSKLTYQPMTEGGKQFRGLFDQAMSKVDQGTTVAGERTADMYGPTVGPAIGAAEKTGLNALLMALGRTRKPGVNDLGELTGQPPTPNLFNKPAGVGTLLANNADKIGANYLRQIAGPEAARLKLADALYNARPKVPGSPVSAAEAVSHMAEGTTLQALQQKLFQTPTAVEVGNTGMGISQAANRMLMEQEGAANALKALRNRVTTSMRESALKASKASNDTARGIDTKIADNMGKEIDAFYSKAAALQDKGRFDTSASQMGFRSKSFTDAGQQIPTSPVTGLQTGAYPVRSSANRYLTGERAKEASAASAEMPSIIQLRQRQLASAQSKLADLQARKAPATETAPLIRQIDSMTNDPAIMGSTIASKALNGVREKLASLTDEHGIIDPEALYSVRKELGLYIDNAIGAELRGSGKWDKTMTAGLERTLQKAFDNSINATSGGKWSPYLNTFSRLSAKLDADALRREGMYKPPQKSAVVSAPNVTETAGIHLPRMLSAPVTGFNWLSGMRRATLEPKVDAYMAGKLFQPRQLADILMKGLTPAERAAVLARRQSLDRAKSLAVGGGIFGQQGQ